MGINQGVPKRRLRAFLFDFSGTLVNDLNATIVAVNHVIQSIGQRKARLRRAEFVSTFRMPYWEFLQKFGISERDARTLAPKIFQQAYLRQMRRVKIFSDVKKTVEELRRRKIQTGIVSSTPRSIIVATLSRQRMKHLFDVVVSLEDCPELKPSPAPIIQAIGRLTRRPQEVAYVGDMSEDIEAARRAHAIPIAIWRENNHYQSLKDLIEANPLMLVRSLGQITEKLDLQGTGRPTR